jgi:DNA-binding NarL/FixJ family response regulator
VKILIVARIPVIREGLKALLAAEKDFRVTTLSVSDSGAMLERVVRERPEVLLLDVEVLEQTGWAFLRDLQQLAPSIATLVISDAPTDRRITNALALGAHGYLLRDASPEQMSSSIRAAHAGMYVLHPMAAEALIARRAGTNDSLDSAPDDADERVTQDLIEPLSERELNVLRLMTRGLANKQIGAELFITEHTVKFHIRSILSKLGASNRTEAVTLALQKGLVTL